MCQAEMVLLLRVEEQQDTKEKEMVRFDEKAEIFHEKEQNWDKLGICNIVILLDEKQKYEINMINKENDRIIASHPVIKETQLLPAKGTDRCYVWTTEALLGDSREEKKTTFFVRFKESDTASLFQEEFQKAQSHEKQHEEMVKGKDKQNTAEEKAANLAEEKAANLAEEEAAKLFEEEAAKLVQEKPAKLAEERAAKLAEERAAKLAEEKAANLAEEEAAKLAEERAAKLAEERAAKLAEEKAAKLAEEEAAKLAEEKAANLAEEEAAKLAEERAAKLAEERAAKLAEERAAKLAEERAAKLVEERAAKLVEERAAKLVEERAAKLDVKVRGDVPSGDGTSVEVEEQQDTKEKEMVRFDEKAEIFHEKEQNWDKLGICNIVILLDEKQKYEINMINKENDRIIASHPVRKETQLVLLKELTAVTYGRRKPY
ncbi:ran-specific GTPase-activating protein 1-like protein [Apostichopus japonicus]|uniref:Ran-specific GTPase-activating protein 1-like protein n=1 Tax=Stichopus japonicus TaxID=307972 RepID=A0A2G8JG17_STIJA|nr:ran-specific GTPase-activating protein 1-like protein [Apostichopus japonicus]